MEFNNGLIIAWLTGGLIQGQTLQTIQSAVNLPIAMNGFACYVTKLFTERCGQGTLSVTFANATQVIVAIWCQVDYGTNYPVILCIGWG